MTQENDPDPDEKLGQDETDAESDEDAEEDDDEAPISSEDEAGP